MNAEEPLAATEPAVESDADRLLRLHRNPEMAELKDVEWLTLLVRTSFAVEDQFRAEMRKLNAALDGARDAPGRVIGLREAADLVRAAAGKEVTTRFLVGKRENAARAMNSKLVCVLADLIDRYSVDVEKRGRGDATLA